MASEPDEQRWLAYSEEDWAYGKLGVSHFPRAAAWSFQQAAEKALKACVIKNGKLPPRTHDLLLLLNLISDQHPEAVREAVLLLAEISTAGRYPDDAEPVSETLAQEYSTAARVVLDYVKRTVGTPSE